MVLRTLTSIHYVMPAKAGMTAKDVGNATGLPGASLVHYSDASETLSKHFSMDTGSEAGMTPFRFSIALLCAGN